MHHVNTFFAPIFVRLMKCFWRNLVMNSRGFPFVLLETAILLGFGTLAKVGTGNVDTPGSCEIQPLRRFVVRNGCKLVDLTTVGTLRTQSFFEGRNLAAQCAMCVRLLS